MVLYGSLIDMLADARGRAKHIHFIDGETDESKVSFDDIWLRSSELLGALQEKGMVPGDELVIFSKSNEEFIIAFWAAVLGGIVPVPVAVGISDEHRLKLFRILQQMRRGTLYTDSALLAKLKAFAESQELTSVVTLLHDATVLMSDIESGQDGNIAKVNADDLAFIQYSSGSTSDPKGVCLTHGNLGTNFRAVIEKLKFTPEDHSLSWMPLTHDMGLIGYHLTMMAAGMNHTVMDTSLFVRRPLLWMSKASELRATQLCSPNFGYKHFLKMFERKGLDGLDLSNVRLILNGAEPISWELCEEFMDAMAPFGLRRNTMHPVYGLAEATVAVTFPEPGHAYSRITANRHSLKIGTAFENANPGDADAVSFLKVGRPIRDVELRIADEDDLPLADGLVGNILLRGGSVTSGLYNADEAQAELFTADGWLRTGDVGVIVDGDLVITGRVKDIIIINGQNYYPHDLEEIVAAIEGLDLGKVVISGVRPADSPVEQLVVFVLHRQGLRSFAPLVEQIRDRIGAHAGLDVDQVVPVARIPKTTSGKVQRAHLAAAYLDGEFAAAVAELGQLKSSTREPTPESDPLVAELLAICSEFAKDRRISADDNLFETGISSLTLTEIMLAVDLKFPGKVDVSDLFDYPTVRQMADFIRSKSGSTP
ncbi:MAG: non-ribosomal peptide synthetase [Gammaproteobacteria bacterium]|nr:non-ribosomal peptide synthetase [Gammaproteobacteria bacterium]